MCEKRVENRIQTNHSQKEHQPADKSERKQDDCCNKYNYRDIVGQQHVNNITTSVVCVRDRLGRDRDGGRGGGVGQRSLAG